MTPAVSGCEREPILSFSEDIPFTDITAAGYGPVFAPGVEDLARIMYEEMRYLNMTVDMTWEELPARERQLYAFVIERVLVERVTILNFFSNDGDIGCCL